MECLLKAINNERMTQRSQKTRDKVGKKIQRFRKSVGLSQEEFAHQVGISRTHAGHIEQGRKFPSLEVLEKIAKVLKVKVRDLFP